MVALRLKLSLSPWNRNHSFQDWRNCLILRVHLPGSGTFNDIACVNWLSRFSIWKRKNECDNLLLQLITVCRNRVTTVRTGLEKKQKYFHLAGGDNRRDRDLSENSQLIILLTCAPEPHLTRASTRITCKQLVSTAQHWQIGYTSVKYRCVTVSAVLAEANAKSEQLSVLRIN